MELEDGLSVPYFVWWISVKYCLEEGCKAAGKLLFVFIGQTWNHWLFFLAMMC